MGMFVKKKRYIPLFQDINPEQSILIHTAGIIDISEKVSSTLYNVNVNGTKNIAELALQYKIKKDGLCQLRPCNPRK